MDWGKDETSSNSGTTIDPACMLVHEVALNDAARSTNIADRRAISDHDQNDQNTFVDRHMLCIHAEDREIAQV